MRIHTITRALGTTALGLTLAFTATACGQGADNTAPQRSATEHNAADVAFASDMVQHHSQALSMVDVTLGRTLDPEVADLAEEIRNAQSPEIETFTDWLDEWGEPIPATMRDHVNAPHDGEGTTAESMEGMDTEMPGMMSADDMTALEDAPDSDFQRLWLEMMVEHHTGALTMAETEIDEGRYEPAVDLAEDIVASQSAEIDTMEGLLG